MDGPRPWERQPGESPKAFAAFQSYRDQPRMERSIRDVAISLRRNRTLIGRWSAQHDWVARVAAWDQEQDRLLQERLADEREAFARRLAATGAMLLLRGVGKVRTFIDRIDRDGLEVALRPGERYVDQLSVSEATRLIDVGARIEMLGRGMGPGAMSEPDVVPVDENPVLAVLTRDPAKVPAAVELMEELMALLEDEGAAPAGEPGRDERVTRVGRRATTAVPASPH